MCVCVCVCVSISREMFSETREDEHRGIILVRNGSLPLPWRQKPGLIKIWWPYTMGYHKRQNKAPSVLPATPAKSPCPNPWKLCCLTQLRGVCRLWMEVGLPTS